MTKSNPGHLFFIPLFYDKTVCKSRKNPDFNFLRPLKNQQRTPSTTALRLYDLKKHLVDKTGKALPGVKVYHLVCVTGCKFLGNWSKCHNSTKCQNNSRKPHLAHMYIECDAAGRELRQCLRHIHERDTPCQQRLPIASVALRVVYVYLVRLHRYFAGRCRSFTTLQHGDIILYYFVVRCGAPSRPQKCFVLCGKNQKSEIPKTCSVPELLVVCIGTTCVQKMPCTNL